MTTITCRGSACDRKERCRLYGYKSGLMTRERICVPKHYDSFEPIPLVRSVGTWERESKGRARAAWFKV